MIDVIPHRLPTASPRRRAEAGIRETGSPCVRRGKAGVQPASVLVSGVVCGLAAVGVVSVLYTSPWGTGTGWDQAMYIGSARNLLAGRGLTIAWGSEVGAPLSHYAPAYPFVLAVLGRAGWDPWDIARYLNAALRGIDLLLVAYVAWLASGGQRWSALTAGVLMLTSVDMEFVHGSAWSEPLFFILFLPSLLLISRYVNTGSRTALVSAAALAAAAALTRYAGLTLVPIGIVILLSRRKPLAAASFGGIACLPVSAWLVHNLLAGGEVAGNRALHWAGLAPREFGQAFFTVMDWLVPTNMATRLVTAAGDIEPAGAVLLLGTLTLGGWWLWLHRGHYGSRTPETKSAVIKWVLSVFAILYAAGIVVARLTADSLVQFDSRILAPVFVCLVVLVSAWLPGAVRNIEQQGWPRAAIAIALAGLTTMYAVRFGVLVVRMHGEGVMYSNAWWLSSETMNGVRELPVEATVFSNAPDAIYMLANRSVADIPDVEQTDSFARLMQQTTESTATRIMLVYFSDPNIAYRQPVPINAIQQYVATRLIAATDDGQIFEVGGARATGGAPT